MKAKIDLRTFEREDNQGSVISIGTYELEITCSLKEQVTKTVGCCSRELVYEEVRGIVKIGGRRFLLERHARTEADYEVTIPKNLADNLKFCPSCNTLLP